MNLYLIRHAEAVPLGEQGIENDEDRPLTEAGHAQSKLVALGLQKRDIHLDVLSSSPLLRAQETAAEILKNWKAKEISQQDCKHLAPGGKIEKLARFLNGLGVESIALVGHQPDLGELAGWLIGSRKADVNLVKAGVACLRSGKYIEKGCATLQWLVTPEWLE